MLTTTEPSYPALLAIFVSYAREIIKDVEDIEGDTKATQNHIYTLPALFGVNASILIAKALIIVVLAILIFPFIFDSFSYFRSYGVLFFIVVFYILYIWVLFYLRGTEDVVKKRTTSVKKLMKYSMVIGLIGLFINPFTLFN